jgi:superfamily I DNA/RNA helicase
MARSASVAQRLDRLAPDQRAAATAPPGPILCVAPAGSGKTTTLVARIAWLVDGGTDPASIAAITFNKRAAEELEHRLREALEPLGVASGASGASGTNGPVRVRTFHALGREILAAAGVPVEPLRDRDEVLREALPSATAATRRRLDTAISRLKLDLRVDPDAIASDPAAGPVALAWVAYERVLRATGGLDFDDLVARSLALLERDAGVRDAWRRRCSHLLVDEAQDLDRSQLDLALALAAPANRIFLVGDDDQSIYGWRLADVRRVLGLAASLPGLRRVDLVTNYRCPSTVVDRAVRLVEHNTERFVKRIRARPGAGGPLILGADGRDETERVRTLLLRWPATAATFAILARTNRELLPAIAVAMDLGRPFRCAGASLLIEDERLDGWLDEVAPDGGRARPLLARLGAWRDGRHSPAAPGDALPAAVLGWAAGHRDLASLRAAITETRRRLAELRRDDAPLTLATVHGTKGLEWDHVAVLGMETGRFPSRRAVDESTEPQRALEEERRLAYVAWTRARRSLTLLYDPDVPSPFLLEAFDPAELRAPAG